MEEQIIFYGAGEWAQNNLDRLLKWGLRPLCFVDKNDKKHHTFIKSGGGAYEILPLSLVTERYPDYKLYLTIDAKNLKHTASYLKEQGIPDERLNFLGRQMRIGCKFLGSSILISGINIRVCCMNNVIDPKFFVIPYENLDDGLSRYKEIWHELTENFKNGIAGKCAGCLRLSEDFYDNELKIQNVLFTTGFYKDVCTVKCIYCKEINKCNKSKMDLYDSIKQIIEKFDDNLDFIQFANGEFLAREDADEILNYLSKLRYKIRLTTNATVYKDSFMRMLHLKKVYFINCSLDCGTKETYVKIKRRDLFTKVVENLYKYSKECPLVELKYIMLPDINDNMNDIEGFVNIAKTIKANVIISANSNVSAKSLPKYTFNMALILYDKIKNMGLSVRFDKRHFSFQEHLLMASHRISNTIRS